jgi:phage terminase Nu1 subunit (DNA packaging protein)
MAQIKLMGMSFIGKYFGVSTQIIERVVRQSPELKRLCKVIQGRQRFAWPFCEKLFAHALITTSKPEVVDKVKAKIKELGLDIYKEEGLKKSPSSVEPEKLIAPVKKQKRAQWYEDAEDEEQRYTQAAKKKLIYQAEQEKLKYERDAGKVIDINIVMKEWSNIAVSVQKAILTVPDRVAPLCVGKESFEIHTLLMMELKYALKNLSFEMKDQSNDDDEEAGTETE